MFPGNREKRIIMSIKKRPFIPSSWIYDSDNNKKSNGQYYEQQAMQPDSHRPPNYQAGGWRIFREALWWKSEVFHVQAWNRQTAGYLPAETAMNGDIQAHAFISSPDNHVAHYH